MRSTHGGQASDLLAACGNTNRELETNRHRRWWVAVSLTLTLHFAWEMGQSGFFADFTGQRWWRHLLRCLGAAAGDLAIATSAYLAVAAICRRRRWPFEARSVGPAVLWLTIGEVVTITLERWAVAVGRWSYAEQMPLFFGIGILPVLQWLVIPIVTLGLLRRLRR